MSNEPVDILTIASQRIYYARNMLNSAMHMNWSSCSQQDYDSAWAQYSIAQDDMAAVQSLILDLAR